MRQVKQTDIVSGMKNASKNMILSFGSMATGLVLFMNIYTDYKTSPQWRVIYAIMFVVLMGGGFWSLVLNTINYVKFSELKIGPPRRGRIVRTDQTSSPTNVELVPNENEQAAAEPVKYALEVQTTDNQIRRSIYRFSEKEWKRLHDRLRYTGWGWSKRRLGKTKIFTTDNIGANVSAPNVYETITKEFIKIGAVGGEKGKRIVTIEGQRALKKAARVE
jgi:hypothetical protein